MSVVWAGLVGLILGPLVGVFVDRMYEWEKPEFIHRCQVCRSKLDARSLVPIVGWFSSCPTDPGHSRRRYVLVDLFLAGSFALLAYRVDEAWMLFPYLGAFLILVGLAEFDYETHLLPDTVVWPLVGASLCGVLILSTPNGGDDRIIPALVGSAIFGGGFWFLHRVYPPGLGFGDVKLALALGALLGWRALTNLEAFVLVIYTILGATTLASVVGMPLKYLFKVSPSAPMPEWIVDDMENEVTESEFTGELPMGPFLIFATLIVVAFSENILS